MPLVLAPLVIIKRVSKNAYKPRLGEEEDAKYGPRELAEEAKS